MKPQLPVIDSPALLQDIRLLIEESRSRLAVTVNSALSLLYWHIGQRIRFDMLKGGRAEYGQQILPGLSAKLSLEYGRGWSERNLAYMIRFAEVFPDADILQTLCAKLSWSHFRQLIAIDDPLKRTVLSKKPEQTIAAELEQLAKSDALEPCLLFKDPYVLDFLQLNDRYLEKDLEDAILRWLAKYEQEPGEASPLSIALCSGKKQEQIELLELDQTGIHVPEYLTELPPKAVLQQKLHDIIRSSRQRLGGDQLVSNQ